MKRILSYIALSLFVGLFLTLSIYFLISTLGFTDVLQHVLLEILSGLIVSFSFIFILLRLFRPKFEISKYICFRDGKYYFKVINKSIYHAYDISFEVYLMKPYTHTDGNPSLEITPLKLSTNKVTTINRHRSKMSNKDRFCLFAITIGTTYNIEDRIKDDDTFLEFRITARHGLSGLSDRFVMKYANELIIKHAHKFEYGNGLNTIPLNQA